MNISHSKVRVPRFTIVQGTITTDIKGLSSTVTWNNVAVDFVHHNISITNTTSAPTSSVQRFSVNGFEIWNLRAAGFLDMGRLAATPTIQAGRANGSIGAYTSLLTNDIQFSFTTRPHVSAAPSATLTVASTGTFRAIATENHSPTALGTRWEFLVTANGTAVRTIAFTVDQDSRLIAANGITITAGTLAAQAITGTTLVLSSTATLGNMGVFGMLNVGHVGASSTAITVGDGATVANGTGLYFRTSGTAAISTAGGPFVFYVGGAATTEAMRITAAGNVGINAPSAPYPFTMRLSSTQNLGVRDNGGVTDLLVINDALDTVQPLKITAASVTFSAGISATTGTLAYLPTLGTYVDADATPTVLNAGTMLIANTGATTITNFDDGVANQIIVLTFADANTTINRDNCYLAGGANFTSSANDSITLIKKGAVWIEVCRSVNA